MIEMQKLCIFNVYKLMNLERNIFLEGGVLTQKEISSHIKNVFMYLTCWY